MPFIQDPPALGNQYDEDSVLRAHLARMLPEDVRTAVEPELREMGELAGGELYRLQLEDRPNEPRLVQWDAWGNRVDRIELTPLWQRARVLAAEHGLVALPNTRPYGSASRVVQFALVYLFDPSTDVYTCPLAMSDGAARTLLEHEAAPLARAVEHLGSRDPARAWTSGQWMTEKTGGSDVGLTQTRAEPAGRGAYGVDQAFLLYGSKWFTSAATSDMALTLARPVGAPEGGRGLTLFYLETRDERGLLNGITIDRLKDKLGTRKVPTAELTLDGTLAVPVAGIGNGVRAIAPMLNVTRTWNAVCAAAGMRRGLALARDYARRRVQFGAPLADKPLHVDTLAGLAAELDGALVLAFRLVELLGRVEAREANEHEQRLLRLLTPIAKLTTAKQAVSTLSEVLECFGGAGYVEDTGLPRLLRDAQVLPIWEGTTNVLSLDLLRAAGKELDLGAIGKELDAAAEQVRDAALGEAVRDARQAVTRGCQWLESTAHTDPLDLEAGARRLALTMGRSLELGLLARHAQWCKDHLGDDRPAHAVARLRSHGVDLLRPDITRRESAAIAMG